MPKGIYEIYPDQSCYQDYMPDGIRLKNQLQANGTWIKDEASRYTTKRKNRIAMKYW